MVHVTGGSLDAATIQKEIANLSRVDWNWEVLPHGDDTFFVAFPSAEELSLMAEIEYKLRSGITITIKQWDHGDATPSYNLDELWVHVAGVCMCRVTIWAFG